VTVNRFPVEESTILLFARAVGDPNPIYTDMDYANSSEVGGIIAPPTYVQSSAQFDTDYPLRPKADEPWFGSGRTPSGGGVRGSEPGSGGTALHAEQHFQYHRPLRVGDVLSSTSRPGERWEKQGRSGKLIFNEVITEYRDEAGDLVTTARSVGVMTQRPTSEPRP
jgi:acyl dehydratase